MTKASMEKKYFNFLLDIVGNPEQYSLLLVHLHNIEFYSLVPNDDNRGIDGGKLREIFCDSERSYMDLSLCPGGPCSVLEMLIGLSHRMSSALEGNPRSLTVSECFWALINNLGLFFCDNHEYYAPWDGNQAIDEIISRFLERKYERDGRGGLFPLNFTKKDQRKVEIWYQMSEYLLENYEF